MEYITYSHRFAESILEIESEFKDDWNCIKEILNQISDEEIINEFEKGLVEKKENKSLSVSLNSLLRERFCQKSWNKESAIFKGEEYNKKSWKLDFAKNKISIEVAFNHSGVISWNLLKPVLASELNHVEKAIDTKIGIIICATTDLKKNGGFDNAVGTFENYIEAVRAMNQQLTVPILIIGLSGFKNFNVIHNKNDKGKTVGKIILNK